MTTTVDFTLDTAWSRAKASVHGSQAEAWVVGGYHGGLGYDSGVSEDIILGTPGYPHAVLVGDVNGDGVVNILCLVWVASHIGQNGETAADNRKPITDNYTLHLFRVCDTINA